MPTTRELWDKTVQQYLSRVDVGAAEVLFPALTHYVGDVTGKVILDYGCGDGQYSRILEMMGAAQVIGVDTSSNMIKEAIGADLASKVQYYEVHENKLKPVSDCSIDIVVANMVFMMSSSKEDLAQSIMEIYRVLRPTGELIYCITHPAFIDREVYDYRNVFGDDGFNYIKEGYSYTFVLKGKNGEEIDGGFCDYHYSLSTYLRLTISTGFQLIAFEELSYPDDVVIRHGIPEKYRKYPHSILMVVRKPEVAT
jgi:SAM-dependent methyltransferase